MTAHFVRVPGWMALEKALRRAGRHATLPTRRLPMRTCLEKHPGGVAIVIPEEVAARAGLRGGEPVELEVTGGRLVVRPVGPATLAELLAGITPENLHGEWAAGPPAGAELL